MPLNIFRENKTESSNSCISNLTDRLLNKRLLNALILYIKSKQPNSDSLNMSACCALRILREQSPSTLKLRIVNS